MTQLKINYLDPELPEKVRKFFEFHEKHPRIYKYFKKFAFEIFGKKPTRVCSSAMIYERIRYEIYIKEDDVEEFKMNNDYRAAYARMFMKEYPHYDGLIPVRSSIFDDYI